MRQRLVTSAVEESLRGRRCGVKNSITGSPLMNPSILVATALLLAGSARAEEAAPNADKRAINIAVQRDARGNQSAAAALRLPVGRNAWLQAGAGQSRRRDEAAGTTLKPRQVAVGGGVAGRQWQAGLSASRRSDGDRLRQTDWAATADWQPADAVNLGVDAVKRSARARGAGPAVVEQRLSGHGVGVHGAVAVTPQLSLYAATMRNRYRSSTTQAAGSGQGGLLGPVLGAGRVSVVNRDEAALDRSHQLGATYRLGGRVALNGELAQDRVHQGGKLSSLQMKAAIDTGSGWTLTPGLGRSWGPQGERVSYGSLGASYAW
jgi:hypothetical protein